MPNTQLPRAAFYAPNGLLTLHSQFPTIQGEGPFCGRRAYFFRLAECNLQCRWCDTDYTSNIETIPHTALLESLESEGWARGALVVVTGGEPMRQNIAPAIRLLLSAGYPVQVETNGVIAAPDLPWDHPYFTVVVSPKTSHINSDIYARAKAFKYVLQSGEVDPEDGLPVHALGHPAAPRVARPRPGAPVYIQPMDAGDPVSNEINLQCAIATAMDFGHTLQIQVHKIIGLQ